MKGAARPWIRAAAQLAALGMAASLLMTLPVRAENVLRWAWDGANAVTFDPHSANSGPDITQQNPVYERLLDTSAGLEVVPQLAVAWRPINALTWEIELRQGVRFHDGSRFSAADVVFSLERARARPSQYAVYFAGISGVRIIDAHTLRITTRATDPLLPDRLRKLFIMSKAWAEQHGATRPADYYDASDQNYAVRNANGTGPFILETFEPNGRIVLRRSPAWWGDGIYPVNIDRIEFAAIATPEQRLKALLDGEIDLLISPPFSALRQLEGTPGLKLVQTTSLRSVWLGFDHASPELRSSDVKGRNPFSDERVRRAIYLAIDIEAIRDQVMQGLSVPAGLIIPPGVNGYAPELDRRLPYDPGAAKALLAEAGYPDGFAITLDCPSNDAINGEAICRAVAEQLAKLGIAVTVIVRSMETHYSKVETRQSDFWLETYIASTLDSQEVFLDYFHSRGAFNKYGYSSPRVDELIEEIDTTLVTYARDAQIEEVWRILRDDMVFLPLHHQVVVFAMRENVNLPVSPFGVPIFPEAWLR